MGMLSARLFSFIQATQFYAELHRQAVALLPPGNGGIWLDAGCGPGLVARLAAQRGYCATGLDIDASMIRLAIAEGRRQGSPAGFEVAPLESLPDRRQLADVISAASLLAVIRDRARALRCLTASLAEHGKLLLVEPSERMTPEAAASLPLARGWSRDSWVLSLWAGTRTPARAVGWNDTRIDGYETQRVELLEGLVNAWIIGKASAATSDIGGGSRPAAAASPACR